MSELTKEFLSDQITIGHLPHSKCRNCKGNLRLYKGRWYHIDMAGGKYYQPFNNGCERPYPLRCVKCGGRIDYRITETGYYNFECPSCIEASKKDDKIGNLTDDLRKQLGSGSHKYLRFGTRCSVVLTKNGIFFEDIC